MKQLQINCPEGHEIDQEKSNLLEGIVYFKEVKKVLTYEDVAEKLFNCRSVYYIGDSGELNCTICSSDWIVDNNVSTTEAQLESILALNKLCNVAKYLNEGWLPNWSNGSVNKYTLSIYRNKVAIEDWSTLNTSSVYFKTEELAQQAIDILGEDEVRKALTLNH